jgi:Ca2+/Na+ antiporter
MDAFAIVRLALSVLTDRLISILALCMACGLSCWVMYIPTWDRVVTLGIFVLYSYLVIRTKESSHAPREEASKT